MNNVHFTGRPQSPSEEYFIFEKLTDGAIRELIEEQSTDVSEEILEDGGEEVEEVLEDGGEEVEGFVEVVEYPSPQYLNEEREDEEVLLEDIAEGDEEEEEEYEVTHFDRGC